METTSAPERPATRVIEVGDHFFSHPKYPYRTATKSRLTDLGFAASEIVETDTRLTFKQVHKELRAILNPIINGKPSDYDWNMEYFGPSLNRGGEKWPADATIAVYPTLGGSEGWIINVATVTRAPDGTLKHDVVLWGKMFGGKEAVWQTTRHIADALGAI